MDTLIWFQGVLHTNGGQVLMYGTIDECANEFPEVTIVRKGLTVSR